MENPVILKDDAHTNMIGMEMEFLSATTPAYIDKAGKSEARKLGREYPDTRSYFLAMGCWDAS